MDETIQQLFYDDIKSKKQAGSGVYKRKGKGVRHGLKGGLRFAYQNMSKQNRNDYIGPRRLIVTSMDDLLSKEEFLRRSKTEQKVLLERWRDLYTNEQILRALDISRAEYDRWLNVMGLAGMDEYQ